MSKAANQNLSLGKLKRAVDGTDSYTTTDTSLVGQNASSTQTSMSSFSIDAIDEGLSGFTYLWEQTSEDYTNERSSIKICYKNV